MPRIKYKCCSGCKETLPQTNFYSHRGTCDGLKYLCKPCNKEQEKKRVMRLVQLRKERKIDVNDQKVCKHCDRLKPMSEFPMFDHCRHQTGRNGFSPGVKYNTWKPRS